MTAGIDVQPLDRDSADPVAPPQSRYRRSLLGVAVSAALFIALYSRIDAAAVWRVVLSAHPVWLVVSTGAIVPITLVLALRFYWATPARSLPGFGEAVRLTLVATAFNMFLPSKAGDLVKSYFVAKRSHVSKNVAFSIIVYERLCDFLGLTIWCLVGLMVAPESVGRFGLTAWLVLTSIAGLCLALIASQHSAGWLLATLHKVFPSRRFGKIRELAWGWPALHSEIQGRRRWIALISIGLWFGHLSQMWMFTKAVSASVPIADGFAIFALSVLAGQLPLTFAGFGARDVAIVVLLASYMPAEAAAAIGLLSATRGILPALAAVPIMRPYLSVVAGEATRWRQRSASGD